MRLLMFLALSFATSTSFAADILLEPYVGYHMGNNKRSGLYNDDVKGATYGGRLGVEQLGFMIGVDYMGGQWTDNENPSRSLTPENIGVFVGFEFPLLMRAYAEYDFSDKQAVSVDGYSGKYKDGSGFKLGLGFKLVPMVSLNFEYIAATYGKADGDTLDPKMNNTMYGVNVSLPFKF